MGPKGIEELKNKYVKELLSWHHEHNLGKDYGVAAMRELVHLSKVKGPDTFVPIIDFQRAGIPYGIGRWVSSGVVEKAEGKRAYRIRREFYEHAQQALLQYDSEYAHGA